jgi:hypothetical protein
MYVVRYGMTNHYENAKQLHESPSRKADSYSVSLEIFIFQWNQKVHHIDHKINSLNPVLIQLNSLHSTRPL